jgi:outer membrane lipoprotein SlyB
VGATIADPVGAVVGAVAGTIMGKRAEKGKTRVSAGLSRQAEKATQAVRRSFLP